MTENTRIWLKTVHIDLRSASHLSPLQTQPVSAPRLNRRSAPLRSIKRSFKYICKTESGYSSDRSPLHWGAISSTKLSSPLIAAPIPSIRFQNDNKSYKVPKYPGIDLRCIQHLSPLHPAPISSPRCSKLIERHLWRRLRHCVSR